MDGTGKPTLNEVTRSPQDMENPWKPGTKNRNKEGDCFKGVAGTQAKCATRIVWVVRFGQEEGRGDWKDE